MGLSHGCLTEMRQSLPLNAEWESRFPVARLECRVPHSSVAPTSPAIPIGNALRDWRLNARLLIEFRRADLPYWNQSLTRARRVFDPATVITRAGHTP